MQQTAIVVGFSELKSLLMEKYKINKPREKIRLYFTEEENQLAHLNEQFQLHGFFRF